MKNNCICICIYPKDVQRLLNKSYRASCVLLQNTKKHFGKQRHQLVTVEEFCSYIGISVEYVKEFLSM